ncbi:outer membrane protein [Marinobacter alexandrii]|uniref:outer membrane protein n=1 Tax=Marinobacter alexandrii TaxID=2570351 RepID=UPI003299EE14
MFNNKLRGTLLAASVATASAVMSGTAMSADFYVAGSLGLVDQDDSSTDGKFTSDFTTGTVTGVNPPLTIPAGNKVGWDTKFDDGDGFNLALGMIIESFRVELEYSATDADVDKHTGVSAAGIDLTSIDAGVLITGNVGDLGVSVGDLVANGQGSLETESFFLNGFYDFHNSTNFTPFIGAGIGYTNIDVDYKPSNVQIINDDDDVFSYQVSGGVSYAFTDFFHLVGSIRYRTSDDASVNSSLLPAKFDIENESLMYDIGLRYNF